MNYKLIMLPNPILVKGQINIDHLPNLPKGSTVIAGIEGLPILDLSVIAEKIGWVDVEKLAELVHPNKNPDNVTLTNTLQLLRNNYIAGFKAAQSLNEKKFSEDDVKKAILMAWDDSVDTKNMYDIIESLSKPKEYNVDYIQEGNTIKVTKIL